MSRRVKSEAANAAPGFSSDPLWYKDAIIYQVHLKSFFDANDDGVGDFAGLIQKLDYIAELGVNTVWLLPFYPSPRRDDGYDIAEYKAVHPDYGKLADVRRFINEAHERGIRVITELVINHTSDQHSWFQRARHAKKGSAARNFYVWSDTDQAYDGTRIIFLDTEKSNWTWDPVAGQYFWHRFFSHQPDLNFDNPAVLKAVLDVMRFWLDMGVDGLRLDAVPYLIEREGTNNENLPETHDILKIMRREIDEHYPDRMLLAEANQWPEDTQDYFGQGDECHMAFHFPLMPRMYMAIAREDRFPITDIMRQTPAIPEACQWAIFLRNHDELTLEMVTDSERDYLWETYAADKRARINLGIRRRLAPLLERDRRRIELMNALLLTMPGTPVLYYGDEIGMGDNIHLGDRDGVRTPMQWSLDRNGGFSRADPASLVLPPIMDPLYGYQSINVESQARDPHSMLNWTRRMLAVRKRYKAFGRGTLKFLYPGNRKVLAYLREFDGEQVLCVANMSRSLQAVELDLAAFDGQVPIEIMGGSSFPPLGRLPYLLTLPPYGFYAFQICANAQMPDWHVQAAEPMPDYETLVVRGPLVEGPVMAHHRGVIEREILPKYLAVRRWFTAKDKGIESVRLVYAAPWPDRGDDLIICEIEATLADGRKQRYSLPAGIVWEDENPSSRAQQLALARVRRGRRIGLLTDGFSLEAFASGLLIGLRNHVELPVHAGGVIAFETTEAFKGLDFPAEVENRWMLTEQSNSSMILHDTAVLKLFRLTSEGINPEVEMSRFLTEHGYANTSPLLGEVVRIDEKGERTTLAVLQGFLRNQGDAWRWTLDYLSRSYDEYSHSVDTERREEIDAGYDNFARAVGTRLGELHAVLAAPTDAEDFSPRTATADDVASVRESVVAQLERALSALDSVSAPASDLAADAAELHGLAAALKHRIGVLAEAGEGTLLTRAHGDFHLGQILVVQDDAYIIDFEGEPARTLAERRAKVSALRDVAGFLRSLDYAAAMAKRGEDGLAPVADPGFADYLARFRERSAAVFLSAYRAVLDAAPVRWVSPEALAPLVELFVIEKAAYEVSYEAANRPTWLDVPVRGLLHAARGDTASELENDA
ncbi:maltose alpha-D-glucosyltransferase/alpha-amylase [Luteibacter sp. Sphag1AF]|uniref:maltose alpha-D-glucosyltransferase n=1 Tax=Luteibacter sp. Sphag1AF TaxID=2587031 RepID=UPI00160ECC79|nr:maltose alpha-D-glucosyltransferase [Luteibacter sp. Sphag1AF]MBB3226933.1 maltose alpha-D-glucosyltransferase/alpha-amylase [Luteibacter sp. Sphag1AF]